MAGGLAATGLMATTVRAAPSLTVSPQGGAPGDQLTATGTGFQPGAVGIHVDAVAPGGEIAGGVIAPDGTFVVSLTIPIIADGPHQLIACRDITPAGECGEQASASIRVIATAPSTTTTTTPALVALTTTTSTTSPVLVAETTTTGPSPPTIPPVIVSSSTSAPLDEAQPEGEIVPDISIRGVEITQGIQDLASRMPLVAG